MISKYQLIRNINDQLEDQKEVDTRKINFNNINLNSFLNNYPYYKAWLIKEGFLLTSINQSLWISYK